MMTTKTRGWLKFASAAFFAVGVLSIIALFLQLVLVYFSLGGSRPVATDGDGVRYLWTASICVGSMAVAFVLALIARGRWGIAFGIVSFVGLFIAIAAAATLTVPQDRWKVDEASHPLPSNYHPCYSGSGDCN